MTVWAIGDLHLAFGTPDKKMDVFGKTWENYTDKIKTHWNDLIKDEDLVLIPGDISWATKLEDALIDFQWIHELPGTKVIIRGNHDYWWSSYSKLEKVLPPSIHLIQNNTYSWNDFIIGGTRLWDTQEYNFNAFIEFQENPREKEKTKKEVDISESERIFERELHRLELSLKNLKDSSLTKIVMTHYPPISADLQRSKTSNLLKEYGVKTCVFGHLHSVKKNIPLFGERDFIRYILTSADYIDFRPIIIY